MSICHVTAGGMQRLLLSVIEQWDIIEYRYYHIKANKKGVYMDTMTNEQFETILEMIRMILDGCEDIESAKHKVDELIKKATGKKE